MKLLIFKTSHSFYKIEQNKKLLCKGDLCMVDIKYYFIMCPFIGQPVS